MLSLIIPTYNEEQNIGQLLDAITNIFKQHRITYEIIVVDGNSQDNTQQITTQKIKSNPLISLIPQQQKNGLSSAVLSGFKKAKYPLLAVMDADFSHNPKDLIRIYQAITTPLSNNPPLDLVIASRYTKGGKINNWPIYRKVVSKIATLLARPFTKAKDPLSGFFIVRKECLQNTSLNAKGFKICLEILVKSKVKHIKEIPITFQDRIKGQSKANIKEGFIYLKNLLRYCRQHP